MTSLDGTQVLDIFAMTHAKRSIGVAIESDKPPIVAFYLEE